jgi:glycosyltransferase involved in cell wall biosynthesis
MATFNGARFIAEQLASLAAQEVLPCELVVCDDGSTDGTPALVEAFATTAPFPVRLFRNEQNLGFAENFLKAARLCEGDWVAFCDQDDVWLPAKIRLASDTIQRTLGVTMIMQNAFICDEDLNHSGRPFPNTIKPGLHGPRSQHNFWAWFGFLQVFKMELLRSLDTTSRPSTYFPDKGLITHDRWMCLIGNAIGGMVVLGEPVALYRRHAAAITGYHSRRDWGQKIDHALPVGVTHYTSRSQSAIETANYLRLIKVRQLESVQHELERSARSFERLSRIYCLRSEIYSSSNIFKRWACVFGIAILGGYVGPNVTSLGPKSFFKDALQSSGLLKLVLGALR